MSPAPVPEVKICGICTPADAELAVAAGATHIGVIRVPGSRRTQSATIAREVCVAAAGARTVGVFVDASTETILREAEALGLDVIQLHGDEGPERIEPLSAFGYEVWKVVKPLGAEDLPSAARLYATADLLLVEGRSDRGHGGVGARFPWDEVADALARVPEGTVLGVGGGLTPDNVAEAVRRFRPAVVDVSSGVEREVCRKDPEKVREFIRSARSGAGG